jgi:hypothetical protein
MGQGPLVPQFRASAQVIQAVELSEKSSKTEYAYQGSFCWLQNTEGEPLVGGWLQIHQPQVLPLYFAARKKNPNAYPQFCINFATVR